MTARIDSRFPGSTFVVLLDYWGLVTPEAQEKIDSQDQTPPAFYALKETSLGLCPTAAVCHLPNKRTRFYILDHLLGSLWRFQLPEALNPTTSKRSTGAR